MTIPQLITEVMFTSPTWTDISPYVRGANVKRGSSRVDSPIVRYEAGTATVRLDNRDRRFDPTNLAGPYVQNSVADTGTVKFTCSIDQFYGHGYTIDVKSATGQTASIVNVVSKASGTTGSFTVGKPAGTLSGHRMIVIHSCDVGNPSAMTISGGSSWGTALDSFSSGDDTLQTKVWYKTAGGSEPSTYTIGQNSNADGIVTVITIANADSVAVPVFQRMSNPESLLFSTPPTTPAGTRDLELRYVAGNGANVSGVSWYSYAVDGFTEYADKQSQTYTSGALYAKSLTSGFGGGTATRVLPVRPIRLRALWNFIATTNLIMNPSFENDTTGWVDANGNGSIRASNMVAYTGGDCLELSRKQTSSPFFVYGALCQGVTLSTAAAQTVTVSAYVYVPASSFSKISAYSIAGTGLASTFVTGPPVADVWWRVSVTAVLSAQLDDVQIQFWTDDTHGDGQTIAYIDGVQAEVRASASPYCDGDQPACTWTGTAHNSSSTRPATFTFPIFSGYVDNWDVAWEAGVDSEVTVPCTDGFKILGAFGRTALGSPVGNGELSGARVTRVLNSAGWSPTARLIDTGSSAMQGTTMDGDVLTELFLVSDSEIGEFYMDGAGNAVFRGRSSLFTDTRSTNPQARFGDGGDVAGELTYHDVGISYDDVQLYNMALIARTGGVQQVATDTTSVTDFLTHTIERTDLLLTSDAEALSYAQWIVYISKDPELRFDTLVIRPQKDEDKLFPQVLDRDIGDRIKVTRRPPDNTQPSGQGSAVIREVFIRGIEYAIEQYNWEVTYQLQSASKVGSFLTLDHPELGKIGRNGLRF